MAATVFITTEPPVAEVPLWAELEATELRPQVFGSEPAIDPVPLWAELEATELRPQVFGSEPAIDPVPLWAELEATELRPQVFETEPTRSQPYIDGLAPVTVGSDFRNATLESSKVAVTTGFTELSPADGGEVSTGGTITIPCGDRIPEFGEVRVNPCGYSQPSGPGLDDSKTIIIINDELAYMNSAAQGDWSVTSTANLINGFDYEISGPIPEGAFTVSVYLEGTESFLETSYDLEGSGGGNLAGGPRYRVGDGRDRKRYCGQKEDGSLQGDLLSVDGIQKITTFDGGTLED